MVAPVAIRLRPQHVTGGIAGLVIGNRRRKLYRQIEFAGAFDNLLAPVAVNFPREVNIPGHVSTPVKLTIPGVKTCPP
jgi:hypothetical protein